MGNGKKIRTILLFFVDIISIVIAYMLTFYAKYGGNGNWDYISIFSKHLVVIVGLYVIPMMFFKMYRSLWRNAGFEEFLRVGIAVTIGFLLNVVYLNVSANEIPLILTILAGVLIYFMFILARLSYRLIKRIKLLRIILFDHTSKRVLVIGAGTCGTLAVR